MPRYLAYNPLSRVELPKRNERVVRAFTAAELTTFLRAVVGHRYEVWVHLSLGTGLRLSESRGLTWDKVDLAEQTILVDSALDQVSHERGPTKNGKIRTVDMSAQLVAMLAAMGSLLALWGLGKPEFLEWVAGGDLTQPTLPTWLLRVLSDGQF